MNYQLVIVNCSNNNFFSKPKLNSPKMYNSMKNIAIEYTKTFQSEFKVKRVIPTKAGYKII